MKRLLLGLAVCLLLAACLGDPMGPRGAVVVERVGAADTALLGAPGRALPAPVVFRVLDGDGRPIPGAVVRWTVSGGGQLTRANGLSAVDGVFEADWVLGTRATDAQRLEAEVSVGSRRIAKVVDAAAVPVEVASLAVQAETTEVRVGAPARVFAKATDPYGNIFVPAGLRFTSLDTTVVAVDSSGGVRAGRRGHARLVVRAGDMVDSAWIHAIQVVAAIRVDQDTLRFHSLGQEQALAVLLVDDLGLPVPDSSPAIVASNPSIVEVRRGDQLIIQSSENGVAAIQLQVGTVSREVVTLVQQRTASVTFTAPNLRLDALDDTVRASLDIRDSLGVPVAQPRMTLASSDSAVAAIDSTGLVTARGNGTALLTARSYVGVEASLAVNVTQVPVAVTVPHDSLRFEALRAVLALGAVGRDRLGSPVVGSPLTYATGDQTVATVDTSGNVRAVGPGTTSVRASLGTDSVSVSVRVEQRPFRVVLAVDTLRFDALGDTLTVAGTAVDSLGSPVDGSVTDLRVGDTAIVEFRNGATVLARANGRTTASFTVAGLSSQVVLAVNQVPAKVTAAVAFRDPIVTLPVGALLPLECHAFDSNEYEISEEPALVGSPHGTVNGSHCGGVRVERSGVDTLAFALGGAQARVPVIVAAAPAASLALGDVVVADTLPGQPGLTWSPSARRNANGELEVYYSVYSGAPDSSGYSRADLHRLIWLGGNQFRYDGVAVMHDDDICSLQGQGVENMVIMPRADSSGWRMLYAAGSNACYGWQVFSAVSNDGRTWTKEPGVRLSNGGTDASWPPWPVGEGMVVDRLPSGEWRMIAASFEHITPPETTTWQITEWRSTDQLHWRYIGPVLTTRDMPPGWQGSVYSPSIREIAPGLWRMLFTANDRGRLSGRDAVWSAVSTDLAHWQVEGEVLGGVSSNVYYAAMVDDQVVFIRQDNGGPVRLSIATVTMP